MCHAFALPCNRVDAKIGTPRPTDAGCCHLALGTLLRANTHGPHTLPCYPDVDCKVGDAYENVHDRLVVAVSIVAVSMYVPLTYAAVAVSCMTLVGNLFICTTYTKHADTWYAR